MYLRSVSFLNIFASIVGAFWRLPCYSRLGVYRIDPIVSEGLPSQHAHTLHGAHSTFDIDLEGRCLIFTLDLSFSSSYEGLIQSNCTTCAVLEDMSAYWTPPLMFSHTNGTIEIVPQIGGMLMCVVIIMVKNYANKAVVTIFFSEIKLWLSHQGLE
jgi:hypothetical protein